MLLQKSLELQVDVILAHIFAELPCEHGSPVIHLSSTSFLRLSCHSFCSCKSFTACGGSYLWNHNSDTIFGKPVNTSEFMPSAAPGRLPVAFGDFSHY
ncbi:hypothetical protein D7X87_00165 [bacterium D16-54]|nr:hypothetical protein D7X87_00165 [bacterium D16-54]RKJ16759.1 hypothetical protein D7X65_00165 [bacterium D16-56]